MFRRSYHLFSAFMRFCSSRFQKRMIGLATKRAGVAFLILFTAAFTVSQVIVPAEAAAAGTQTPQVQLHVEVGYGGNYSGNDHWVPVRVTISNEGPEIKGQLMFVPSGIFMGNMFADRSTDVRTAVTVPQSASREFTLAVRGNFVQVSHGSNNGVPMDNTASVKLVVGGQTVASAPVSSVNAGFLVGTIGKQSSFGYLLSLLPARLQSLLTIQPITRQHVQENSFFLDNFQAIAINLADAQINSLDQSDVDNLRDWVTRGGTLLMTGIPQNLNPLFQSLMPVSVSGRIDNSDWKSLGSYTGVQAPVGTSPLAAASLKSGQVLAAAGENVIAAKQAVGRGHVIYTGVDLTSPTFRNWSGASSFWEKSLLGTSLKNDIITANDNNKYVNQTDPLAFLKNTAAYMPNLPKPSIPLMISILVLYTAVVGPVGYIWLRRLDRRDWGWFFIPAVSLLCVVCVFTVGQAGHFTKKYSQTLADIEIDDAHLAHVQSLAGYIVPSGGHYDVMGNQQMLLSNVDSEQPSSGVSQGAFASVDTSGGAEPVVHFSNAAYRTLHTVAGETMLRDVGELQTDLHYSGDAIGGTVTNHTRFDLNHTALVIGTQTISLGDLAKNASVQVNQKLSDMTAGGMNLPIGLELFPKVQSSADEYERQRSMLQFLNQNPDRAVPVLPLVPQIKVIGFTDAPLNLYKLGLQNEDTVSLSLIQQNIAILPSENGQVFYPAGTFQPVVADGNVQSNPDGYTIPPDGKMTLLTQINPPQTQITKIRFVAFNAPNSKQMLLQTRAEIFNVQTGSWDLINLEALGTLQGDNLQKYLSVKGELRLRFANQNRGWMSVPYLNLVVEGKVQE